MSKFIPSNKLIQLSKEQLTQILEKGYSHALVNNRVVKITAKDLVFKKEEIDRYLAQRGKNIDTGQNND